MNIPGWAPACLVEKRLELIERIKKFDHKPVTDLRELSPRSLIEVVGKYAGPYFPTDKSSLAIVERLICDPAMEGVWKRLLRRSDKFKPTSVGFSLLMFGNEQAVNLAGACVGVKAEWINTPKRTREGQRKLLTSIADKAFELAQLLVLEVSDDRQLLDVRKYLPKEFYDTVAGLLELDSDGSYLEFVLYDCGLPTVPELLLKLHDKAKEHARFPTFVPQPNAPDAEQRHFMRSMAEYFKKSYGMPLYENVAAIANAVFQITTITSDTVRSLLRADLAAHKKYVQKRVKELRDGENLDQYRKE